MKLSKKEFIRKNMEIKKGSLYRNAYGDIFEITYTNDVIFGICVKASNNSNILLNNGDGWFAGGYKNSNHEDNPSFYDLKVEITEEEYPEYFI